MIRKRIQLIWACGLLVCCTAYVYERQMPVQGPSASTKILSGVPLATQFYDYSCGAAALLSVLSYYGVETDEDEIIKGAETETKFGTQITKMAKFAIDSGVPAEVRSNMTIEDLREQIKLGHPVIVEGQAWP